MTLAVRSWRSSWRVGSAVLLLVLLSGITWGQAQENPEAHKAMLRFGHTFHKQKGVAVETCQDCHSLEINFTVDAVTRGRDHKPCNNTACHASEFSSKTPRICVVCHNSVEPWIVQKARLRKLPSSEFNGRFSHKRHVNRLPCKNCHGDQLAGQTKPNSHAVCGSCHVGARTPLMSDCSLCHLFETTETQERAVSQYSVSSKFRHDSHKLDPRKSTAQAPECQLCHSSVAQADTLGQIRTPAMHSCDACHDGKNAFKTSGFGCAKCHGSSQ